MNLLYLLLESVHNSALELGRIQIKRKMIRLSYVRLGNIQIGFAISPVTSGGNPESSRYFGIQAYREIGRQSCLGVSSPADLRNMMIQPNRED